MISTRLLDVVARLYAVGDAMLGVFLSQSHFCVKITPLNSTEEISAGWEQLCLMTITWAVLTLLTRGPDCSTRCSRTHPRSPGYTGPACTCWSSSGWPWPSPWSWSRPAGGRSAGGTGGRCSTGDRRLGLKEERRSAMWLIRSVFSREQRVVKH